MRRGRSLKYTFPAFLCPNRPTGMRTLYRTPIIRLRRRHPCAYRWVSLFHHVVSYAQFPAALTDKLLLLVLKDDAWSFLALKDKS
jgi:hypothetical protein